VISIRSCQDAAEWNALLARVPWAVPQQAFGFGSALAACFGYLRADYRVLESHGRVVAGIPLVRFAPGGPFRAIHSLSFDITAGPLVDPERALDHDLLEKLADAIDGAAARERAFEARVSVPATAPAELHRFLSGGGSKFETHPCPVIDLARPLEQVERGYDPAVRRALRRADREGLSVEVGAALADVLPAYAFYAARMQEIGSVVKPWRFVEALVAERIGVPVVARLGGRAVGFMILLVAPGVAVFWISGCDPSLSRARPMNAMLGAAVRWAHARGVRRFSLGESHGRPGLVRFKQGWGPAPSHNTVLVRIYRPAIARLWSALEPTARRVYAAWDGVAGGARARWARAGGDAGR
jgi:hypothetical protein